MKNSIPAVCGKTASPHRNSKAKAKPGAKSRATEVNGKPNPDSPLTPEESARRFDILEGIRAIPVKDMPGCWKPLAQSWISHANYGQGVSYASYETLGKETGCKKDYVYDLAQKLLKAKWFVCAGRRQGESKHCRPEIVPGPRLIAYLRSYFTRKGRENEQTAPRVGGTYPNPVGGTYPNPVGGTYPNPVGGTYPNKPFDQPVPRTGVDQPGRVGPADARLGDARPARPALNSEGTIPLSPPSADPDEELGWRVVIGLQVKRMRNQGQSPVQIMARVMSELEGADANYKRWAREEVARLCQAGTM
jgi:hypothetical protein